MTLTMVLRQHGGQAKGLLLLLIVAGSRSWSVALKSSRLGKHDADGWVRWRTARIDDGLGKFGGPDAIPIGKIGDSNVFRILTHSLSGSIEQDLSNRILVLHAVEQDSSFIYRLISTIWCLKQIIVEGRQNKSNFTIACCSHFSFIEKVMIITFFLRSRRKKWPSRVHWDL